MASCSSSSTLSPVERSDLDYFPPASEALSISFPEDGGCGCLCHYKRLDDCPSGAGLLLCTLIRLLRLGRRVSSRLSIDSLAPKGFRSGDVILSEDEA